MQRVRIASQAHKDRVCEMVQALPLDPPMVVEISKYKEQRSVAQNSIYWLWCTYWAGEFGLTKDEVHHYWKEKHLAKIYERDNKGYAELIESVRVVLRSGDKVTASTLHDKIIDLTSTRDASLDQFSEYLDDIDQEAISKNIYLPHPEDMYREAMGR